MRNFLCFLFAVGLLLSGCIQINSVLGTTNKTTNSTNETTLTGPANCGSDLNCLINKSRNCEPSYMLWTTSLIFFGANSSATDLFAINGTENGSCIFYIKTVNASVTYTDETVQQLLKSGQTMDQIQQSEAESNNAMQTTLNKEGTCKFGTSDLTAMLTKWNAGKFSSDDYAKATCSGSMFAGTGAGTTTVQSGNASYNVTYNYSYNYSGSSSNSICFTSNDCQPDQGCISNLCTNDTLVLMYDVSDNRNSASIVADESTYGNNGTIFGAYYNPVPHGIDFSSSRSNYVDAGNSQSLDLTSAYTIEAWIWIDSNAPSGTGDLIVSKAQWGGFTGGFDFGLDSDSVGSNRLYVINQDSQGQDVYRADTSLPADNSYFVAVTYENNQPFVYVNGNAVSGQFDNQVSSMRDAGVNFNHLFIGNQNSYPDFGFQGKINKIKIYARALSAAEIKNDSAD